MNPTSLYRTTGSEKMRETASVELAGFGRMDARFTRLLVGIAVVSTPGSGWA